MAGRWAFQLEPSHVHIPSAVTATISCCAGSPAIPEGITCGPVLNVLGFDHAVPVHVETLPAQQVVTGTGTGRLVGFGSSGAGGGIASGVDGEAIALPEELETPDDPSASGHGTATAGDAGPPQTYSTPALTSTRCPDVGSAARAPKPPATTPGADGGEPAVSAAQLVPLHAHATTAGGGDVIHGIATCGIGVPGGNDGAGDGHAGLIPTGRDSPSRSTWPVVGSVPSAGVSPSSTVGAVPAGRHVLPSHTHVSENTLGGFALHATGG